MSYLVYEIGCLDRPTFRNILPFDLNLLWKNVIANLFSWLSKIRSPSEHALISHNSNSEVVNLASMILSTHYLWSHVARCTWRVLSIIFSPNSSNTKVCDSDIPVTLNYQVFGLYVSMDYVFLVNVFETRYQTSDEKPGGLLVESSILTNVIPQVATWKIVHNQIQVFAVLKSVVHVDNVHVLQLCEDLSFIDNRLNWSFGDYSCFWHLFHCERLSFFLPLDFPYFAEATFPNTVVVNKVGLGNSEGGALKRPLPIIHHFKCL